MSLLICSISLLLPTLLIPDIELVPEIGPAVSWNVAYPGLVCLLPWGTIPLLPLPLQLAGVEADTRSWLDSGSAFWQEDLVVLRASFPITSGSAWCVHRLALTPDFS